MSVVFPLMSAKEMKTNLCVNILFTINNLDYINNIFELRKRIKIQNHKCYLKIIYFSNAYCNNYNKNKKFLQELCDMDIIFLNILDDKQITFHKEMNEKTYFKELRNINDIVYTLDKCDEDIFFKKHKQMDIPKNDIKNDEIDHNHKKLNILGIFDEMFLSSISKLFNITLCSIDDNYTIPDNIDYFVVESCWNGNNGAFRGEIVNKPTGLTTIINKCKERKIPTIFINKEDYINYNSFIASAKLFDYIFTTDINCIEKYKNDCPDSKGIYNCSFFINIQDVTKNIHSKSIISNSLLFAGTFTHREHGTRCEDMIKLMDTSIANDLKLDIINRNSNVNALDVYPNKYAKYLHESISYDDLIHRVHNNYEYILNLNSVSNSETMFARRIIECLVQKKLIISNYSPAIDKYFKNIVFYEKDIPNLKKLSFIQKEIIKHNGFLAVYNFFSDTYFYNNLLDNLKLPGIMNYKIPDYNPKVSIICSTNRIDNINIILENYSRQTYKNTELLVCINLDTNDDIQNKLKDLKVNDKIKVIVLDDKYTLGHCLNKLVEMSQGEIIQKMDDDDFYGKDFITNNVMMYDIYKPDVLGKTGYFIYFKETKQLYIRIHLLINQIFSNFISGSTLSFTKASGLLFGDKNRGEDTELLTTANNRRLKIVNSQVFDYCYIRGSQNNHTWNIANNDLICKDRDILIGTYDTIPYDIITGKLEKFI